MVNTLAVGGDPNSTSGNFSGGYVWTGGYAFPGGNLAWNDTRPVKLYAVGLDYLSNGWARIYHGNSGTFQTGGVILAGGGGFSLEAVSNGGTTYFGRNTGNGGSTHRDNGSYVWDGGLCGWLTWATVTTVVQNVSVAPQAGGKVAISWTPPASVGGAGISTYRVEYADNASFTGASHQDVGGTSTLIGGLQPGKTYYFKVTALNDVGWSAYSAVKSAKVLSGGKVSIGGAWRDAVMKVSIGGVWRDVILRLSRGGQWKDAQ